MANLGLGLATITISDLLPSVTLTEEQVKVKRADTVQIAGGRILHHALALAAGIPWSGLPAGSVHGGVLSLPQHAVGAHVGRNLIHSRILHVDNRPHLGTRIHLVHPLAHPVTVTPSMIAVRLPIQREHALAHMTVELVQIMVDLCGDVTTISVMVAATSLAGLTRPINLATPRRIHITATLSDLHHGRVSVHHAGHISRLPAGHVDHVHVRGRDRRDNHAQCDNKTSERQPHVAWNLLMLRTFLTENLQANLLQK